MRIAVIGGLASGPAAAAEAARTNPNAQVVLFEKEPHISVGSCEIPYFISGDIEDATTLEVLTAEEFEKTRGAKVYTQHRVESIDPERKRLVVRSLIHNSTHEELFDRFILATGARARTLNVEGEDAKGVFTVRGLPDAIKINEWIANEPVQHVVVVGGGFVGLEMADAIRERGLRATILSPDGRVLGGAVPSELAGHLVNAGVNAGVPVRNERAVRFSADSSGRVSAVHTDKGETIGCQAVVVAVGIMPRTELATNARIKIGLQGGIFVDDRMRTSRRNVWACGDGIEVLRVIDGKKILWPLSPVARRTARVAARNAAGQKPADRFNGVTPSFAVRAFGLEAASAGLLLEDAREAGFNADSVEIRHWSRVSTMPGAKRLHVQFVFERPSGRLLGGSLVGEEGAALRANVLVPWIRNRIRVKAIAEDMDLVYTPPVAPAVDPLRIAASAAMRALESTSKTSDES